METTPYRVSNTQQSAPTSVPHKMCQQTDDTRSLTLPLPLPLPLPSYPYPYLNPNYHCCCGVVPSFWDLEAISLSPCFEAGIARALPCQTLFEVRGAAKAGAPLVLLPSLEIRQHGSQNGRALGRHARHPGERHTTPTVRGRCAASPTRHSPWIVLVTAVDKPMPLQVQSSSHAPMENGIVFPAQE